MRATSLIRFDQERGQGDSPIFAGCAAKIGTVPVTVLAPLWADASLEFRDIVREQIDHLARVIEQKQPGYVPFIPS